jgi:hypothetical protein
MTSCSSQKILRSLNELGKLYELKPESVKEPDIYLGANMEKVQMPDGRVEWAMCSQTYVKNAVKIVEALIAEDDSDAKVNGTRFQLAISLNLTLRLSSTTS